MRKKVTATVVVDGGGSRAWHGDTGHYVYGILVRLIEDLLKTHTPGEGKTACFSIVVENTGGGVRVTNPQKLISDAKEEMKRLGLQKQGEVPFRPAEHYLVYRKTARGGATRLR